MLLFMCFAALQAKALLFVNTALSHCSFRSLSHSRQSAGILPVQESMARLAIVDQVVKISSLLKIS
jgi:hypothetical protein